MSLAPQLLATYEKFNATAPDAAKAPINAAREDFARTYDTSKAIQPGQKLPEFRMQNAVGKEVSSSELLSRGPVLLTFYRGEWCPYCNLAVAALQKHVEDFKARGVTLVAISPELPNHSLTMTEKNNLKFDVLTDEGNKFAAKLGILFQQPDSLRAVFEIFGRDMKEWNGDDSLIVPVPATILVDQEGVVRNTFIDPDYTKRCEPTTALKWIDEMKA